MRLKRYLYWLKHILRLRNNFFQKRILILIGATSVILLLSNSILADNKITHKFDLNVSPIPKQIYHREGLPLTIKGTISLKYTDGSYIELPIKKFTEIVKTTKGNVLLTPLPPSKKPYLFMKSANSNVTPQIHEKLYAKIYGKPQGYFIDVQSNYLYIGANDDLGLTWGVYTLLNLIDSSSNSFNIPLVTIVDFPDFFYRSPTYLYTFQAAITEDPAYIEKTKQYIDFLASMKVNAMFWPRVTITGDWKLNEKWGYGEINQHALSRGIRLFIEGHFDLSVALRKEGVKNSRLCMGSEDYSGYCYADDILDKKAKILRSFCEKYKPGGIIFHTIDFDPHWWNDKPGWWEQRCEVCRKKYKDDDRWKADSEQILRFYKAIKSVSSKTEIMVVLWPYHPRMLTGEWRLFPGSERRYKEYLSKITAEIPDDVWIATRECTQDQLNVWLRHLNNRPIAFWIYPGRRNHWIYTSFCGMPTWHKPDYKMACFWNDSGLWLPYELSNMAANQFLWTAKSPGYKIYESPKEMYKSWGSDDIAYKPEIIVNSLMPNIARIIYGDAGRYVLGALRTNVERNDPFQPKDTGNPGWRYSRFEYDIDGKIPLSVQRELHNPVKVFTTIKDEVNEMFLAMKEAIKYLPSDQLRKFVITGIYEKSKQLHARGEGFYNWMLAAQLLNKDKPKECLNYLEKAIAYFEIEESLMLESKKKGFPPEVTSVFGYVPIYWKPIEKLKDWCTKHKINFPSRADIDVAKKHIIF